MWFVSKAIQKVRRAARGIFIDTGYSFFKFIPADVSSARGLRILVYHGISGKNPTAFNSRFLSKAQFGEHLALLTSCYHLISFDDYRSGNLSRDRLNVLLTFDDGYRNNFDHVLPLLVRYKAPAVFLLTCHREDPGYLFNDVLDIFPFLGPPRVRILGVEFKKKKQGLHYRYITKHGEQMAHFFHKSTPSERNAVLKEIYACIPPEQFKPHKEYCELMSTEELKKLSGYPNMELGVHGTTHGDFSELTAEELAGELELGKAYLEGVTGRVCDIVAFPYGNYDEKTLRLCKEKGYNYLLGTEKLNSPADRREVIGRFTVNPYVSAIRQMYHIARKNYE